MVSNTQLDGRGGGRAHEGAGLNSSNGLHGLTKYVQLFLLQNMI